MHLGIKVFALVAVSGCVRSRERINSMEELLSDSEWEADLQKAAGIPAGPHCTVLENSTKDVVLLLLQHPCLSVL